MSIVSGPSVDDRESFEIPMLIGGVWWQSSETYEVRDPFRNVTVARAPRSSHSDLDAALSAAVRGKRVMAAMPPYERAALLRRACDLLGERITFIAEIMARETGKPISEAKAEVSRSQETILLAAEEAVRIEGEQYR